MRYRGAGDMTRAQPTGRVLAFTIVLTALLTGCSNDRVIYDNVVMGTDYSTEIFAGAEGPELRVTATVTNISDDVLDNFAVTVIHDEALDPYIVGGVVELPALATGSMYPADTPQAEVPTDGARGVDVERTSGIVTEGSDAAKVAGLTTNGAILAAVADLAGHVTLKVTWDGGEQILTSTAPVLDPDGLLGG